MKYIVDIKGEIEGDYEIIGKYEERPMGERKNGKWVDDGDPLTLICDQCGYRVARYNNTNFCPNCGNDKRGEHGN